MMINTIACPQLERIWLDGYQTENLIISYNAQKNKRSEKQ